MELTPNQVVSTNLRRIRERNDLTQKTVAELLGWSEESYAQAERAAKGRRVRRFDADELYALANALDTTLAALFCPPPISTIRHSRLPEGATESPVDLAIRAVTIDDVAKAELDELAHTALPHDRERLEQALGARTEQIRAAMAARFIKVGEQMESLGRQMRDEARLFTGEPPGAIDDEQDAPPTEPPVPDALKDL